MFGVGELTVKTFCGFGVGCRRVFGTIKIAQMVAVSASLYVRDKAFASLIKMYAFVSARIVALKATVALVFGRLRETQIAPPVVGAVQIFVVDLVRGPVAGHVEPRQPVRHEINAVDCDFDSVDDRALNPTGLLTLPSLPSRYSPSKVTRFEVVSQYFAQSVMGEIGVGVFVTARHGLASAYGTVGGERNQRWRCLSYLLLQSSDTLVLRLDQRIDGRDAVEAHQISVRANDRFGRLAKIEIAMKATAFRTLAIFRWARHGFSSHLSYNLYKGCTRLAQGNYA